MSQFSDSKCTDLANRKGMSARRVLTHKTPLSKPCNITCSTHTIWQHQDTEALRLPSCSLRHAVIASTTAQDSQTGTQLHLRRTATVNSLLQSRLAWCCHGYTSEQLQLKMAAREAEVTHCWQRCLAAGGQATESAWYWPELPWL